VDIFAQKLLLSTFKRLHISLVPTFSDEMMENASSIICGVMGLCIPLAHLLLAPWST
jgi:hypothetical protein